MAYKSTKSEEQLLARIAELEGDILMFDKKLSTSRRECQNIRKTLKKWMIDGRLSVEGITSEELNNFIGDA